MGDSNSTGFDRDTDAVALWTPSPGRAAAEPITAFAHFASHSAGLPATATYNELYRWSIDQRGAFWQAVWDFCEIEGDAGDLPLSVGASMLDDRFFPEARLNFAENLLKRSGDGDAIVFRAEDKIERRLSWDELRDLVGRLQRLFADAGVREGDRVAAIMPNMPETVAAMLAAASLGAVWTSCSPDFGAQAVIDRFGQIEPRILLAPDGYWYGGKSFDFGGKLETILSRIPSIEAVFIVDLLGTAGEMARALPHAISLRAALDGGAAGPPLFTRFPFDQPLSIHFSSGTTGAPKCILHRAGGVLLQHVKEQRLHCSLQTGDRLFFFSTCGWMMWNWLVSGLAAGATLLLYDGSPFYPSGNVLFDYADAEKCTHFGTSPKFIDSLKGVGLRPKQSHALSHLRTIISTGSALGAAGARYAYEAIAEDVHLASIAGGTDILGCFLMGVPTLPVYAGEVQAPALGMSVDVFDDAGHAVPEGRGELVCTKSFPSMPLGFWGDPEGVRYRSAYFERFPDTWCHGDLVGWTQRGGMGFHGRSDATLNPGGVRIGTAEIYNQLEAMPEIVEAACVGQKIDGDEQIILFVSLRGGAALSPDLEKHIRTNIRQNASPRHVPAQIFAVAELPRTRSGKISELAIRAAVNGQAIANIDALANPESLDVFRLHALKSP